MSKIKSRLERRKLLGTTETSGDSRSQIIEQLKRRMEKIPRPLRGPASDDDERDLPGEEIETAFGPVLVNTVEYAPGRHHGREPVSGFLSVGEGLAVLARNEALAGLDPTGALFLDTETTGLSGGTGTLAFLVGVGCLRRDGVFLLEQVFCRNPTEERAQLEILSSRLRDADYLVTFNGRAFDVPLLNTRFVMNRMANPQAALPHLDLLHVARRIFKRRLDDRSLTALERAVLGFHREGDIPGHAIPAAYADYLKGGSTRDMKAVLSHNGLDLLALAALGGVLERMYSNPAAVEHAVDHLGLARAAMDAGRDDAVDHHLARAGDLTIGHERRDALHMAARHAARNKRFDQARDLWEQIVEIDSTDGTAHLGLAKHFEHREKNFDRALVHARETVEIEGDEGNSHRMARIERKKKKDE